MNPAFLRTAFPGLASLPIGPSRRRPRADPAGRGATDERAEGARGPGRRADRRDVRHRARDGAADRRAWRGPRARRARRRDARRARRRDRGAAAAGRSPCRPTSAIASRWRTCAAAPSSGSGRIDTWINDAGVAIYGAATDVPWEDQRRLFDTNYWGVVAGSLEAVAQFAEQRGAGADAAGKLVNVGSVLSDRAMIFQGPYSASKHAVKGFTDALRMELEEAGEPVVGDADQARCDRHDLHGAREESHGLDRYPEPAPLLRPRARRRRDRARLRERPAGPRHRGRRVDRRQARSARPGADGRGDEGDGALPADLGRAAASGHARQPARPGAERRGTLLDAAARARHRPRVAPASCSRRRSTPASPSASGRSCSSVSPPWPGRGATSPAVGAAAGPARGSWPRSTVIEIAAQSVSRACRPSGSAVAVSVKRRGPDRGDRDRVVPLGRRVARLRPVAELAHRGRVGVVLGEEAHLLAGHLGQEGGRVGAARLLDVAGVARQAAIAARMPTIATAIMISISVKPRSRCGARGALRGVVRQAFTGRGVAGHGGVRSVRESVGTRSRARRGAVAAATGARAHERAALHMVGVGGTALDRGDAVDVEQGARHARARLVRVERAALGQRALSPQ